MKRRTLFATLPALLIAGCLVGCSTQFTGLRMTAGDPAQFKADPEYVGFWTLSADNVSTTTDPVSAVEYGVQSAGSILRTTIDELGSVAKPLLAMFGVVL